MALVGDDCFFFYNQTCMKGPGCNFRHVEEARGSEVPCAEWRQGRCDKVACPFRHSEPQSNRQVTPCYYERQPGGCTRLDCHFAHQFPKTTVPGPPPAFPMQPPVSGPPPVRPGWNPPPVHPVGLPPGAPPPTSGHNWTAPPRPPPPGMRPRFAPPPGPGGAFRPFPPPPLEPMFPMDQAGDKMMPQVDPVIINLNSEESDQESVKGSSPQKQPGRTILPPAIPQANNPLDYFLNAKRWVDPRKRRSPSPRRSSPYRDKSHSRSPDSPGRRPSPARSLSLVRRSQSPVRRRSQSPVGRRSLSPVGRRRSVSVDRQVNRRRSPSLDRSRSQSPPVRDRRRFARRSRSPERRGSRSPGPSHRRPAQQDLRSRLKPQAPRHPTSRPQVPVAPKAPRFEEVKVRGSKIISTKKDKKEEEPEKPEENEKAKVSEDTEDKDFPEDDIKSLEEIYRERALRSMMEAKRKRIQEQKKKRWEAVKAEKKSESESSVKSDTDKPADDHESSAEEKEEEEEEEKDGDNKSESGDESEASLAEDVDVEIDVGEVEEEEEEEEESKEASDKSEESEEEEEEQKKEKPERRKEKAHKRSHARSTVSKAPPSKPSIKSRLGIRAVEDVSKQALKDRRGADSNRADSNRARSIKERLGLRAAGDSEEDKPKSVRSGVIRLSKSSSDLSSRIRDRRGILGQKLSRVGERRDILGQKRSRSRDKELLLVPQITIKNVGVEERRAGIKQRLGMIMDNDSDTDSRHRKKKSLDDELLKLLEEEEIDIDESDMKLLTKKEKKKLLKKLLIQQGREDEYDVITKKKKKGRRRDRDEEEFEDRSRRRERDEEFEDEDRRRKINIHHRLGPAQERETRESGEEAEDQLDSGEEIELEEGDPEPEDEGSPERPIEDVDADTEPADVKENLPSPENEPENRRLIEIKQREKAQRLKEALEPKSLDEIRKERAEKKARGELDRVRSGRNRRILLADDLDDDQPPKSDAPVKVTFGSGDAVLKRKLVRAEAGATGGSLWSKTAERQDKGARRERQIYRPPSLKRIDGPILLTKKTAEAVKTAPQPPPGRDIVDYGDMFPKKPTTSSITVADSKPLLVTAKTTLSRLPDKLPETRSTIRLQKAPPKVEVKDATVKTFAEIMAEKKRKRQQALQESNPERKPFAPIMFDSPEPSSQSSSTSSSFTKGEKSTSDLRSRLSPFEDTSSNDSTGLAFKSGKLQSVSSPAKPDPVTLNIPKKSASIDSGSAKLGRWKRRKTNPDIAEPGVSKSEDSLVLNTQEDVQSMFTDNSSAQLEFEDSEKTAKPSPVLESKPAEPVEVPSKRPLPVQAGKSTEDKEPVPEKKKKLSDSFFDLDDDFLNMSDDDLDLDLDSTQDHDKLLQEIDELLA